MAAIKEGRVTFQRILTYTLNSVQKKVFQALLLAVPSAWRDRFLLMFYRVHC